MKAVSYTTSKEGRRVRVVSSNGLDYTSDNAPDLLTAIGQSKRPDTIAVVWDSALFWKPIFTLLPASVVASLADGKAGHIPGFRLWWGIGRHGRIIGINNKIGRQMSGNIYEQGVGEIEISELKQYYELSGTNVPLSCVELGNELLTTLAKMGLHPRSLASAASIYKECILSKLAIPTMLSMPDETLDIHELAWNTVDEWQATYKSWDEGKPAFSYDLCNAYGSALAELPNLNYAEYQRSPEIPPGIYWGVMRGVIHNKTLVSPLIRPELGRPYVGFWEGVLTTDLYCALRQWDIADIEIKDGWYITLKRNYKPFAYSMDRLFNFRNGDTLQNNLAKAMTVSTWGKMLEVREKAGKIEYGDFFNAIYGSMVVNAIKTKVTDFIYGHGIQDDLISITVDGVKTTRDLDISTERKSGEWRKVVLNKKGVEPMGKTQDKQVLGEKDRVKCLDCGRESNVKDLPNGNDGLCCWCQSQKLERLPDAR